MVEPNTDSDHHRTEEENAEVHSETPADNSTEEAHDPFNSHHSDEPAVAVAENIVVQRHDVLLGRGKGMETHYGNQLFQHLIRCNVARYIHATNREAKRAIINEIIGSIEQKGRFLKCEGRDWLVLDRDEARKKVAHALQYHLRTLR